MRASCASRLIVGGRHATGCHRRCCSRRAASPARSASHAQGDGGYRLVPNWPKLPAGMFFGLKDAPPPPAERDAQAAARRARGGGAGRRGGGRRPDRRRARPISRASPASPSIAQDHIYVFNRGVKPVMVFDTRRQPDPRGRRSGDQRQDDQPVVAALGRRRLGRQRLRHRARRASHRQAAARSSTSSCCSSGRPTRRATTRRTSNLPSGIAILHNGNMIVTDGYGNNRVILFDKTGKFIKQVGKGAGGPTDKGTGPGEWNLPHKLAVDADENLYIIDREGHRARGVRQEPELHPRDPQRLEPVGRQHLAQGHRRHRLDRRSQGRARPEVLS